MSKVGNRHDMVKAMAEVWKSYKEVDEPDESFTSGIEVALHTMCDTFGIDIGEVMDYAEAPSIEEMKRELIQFLGFDGNDFHSGMFDVAMRDKFDPILWHDWDIDRDHGDDKWIVVSDPISYVAHGILELTEIIAALAYGEESGGDFNADYYLSERRLKV